MHPPPFRYGYTQEGGGHYGRRTGDHLRHRAGSGRIHRYRFPRAERGEGGQRQNEGARDRGHVTAKLPPQFHRPRAVSAQVAPAGHRHPQRRPSLLCGAVRRGDAGGLARRLRAGDVLYAPGRRHPGRPRRPADRAAARRRAAGRRHRRGRAERGRRARAVAPAKRHAHRHNLSAHREAALYHHQQRPLLQRAAEPEPPVRPGPPAHRLSGRFA